MDKETTVHLELNIKQLNVVMSGLAKLPIESGLDTFTHIRMQADQQLNPPASPTDVNRPTGPLADKVIN